MLASVVASDIWALVVTIACVVGIGWIFWLMRHGDDDRIDEDAARGFFDEHGHWPDETAEEAAAERARLAAVAAQGPPSVSRPSADGTV